MDFCKLFMAGLSIGYICYHDISQDNAVSEHVKGVVNGLCELGHRVTLITRTEKKSGLNDSVRMMVISGKNSLGFDRAVAGTLPGDIDVLYIRDYFLAGSVISSAIKHRIPVILEHNGLINIEARKLKNTRSKFIALLDVLFRFPSRIRKATKNIVVTPEIARFLSKKYNISPDRFEFVPNGVDMKRFTPSADKIALRRKLGMKPEDAYWIGYIGAMYPWHMLDVVIRGFELLADERDDVMLFVGGSGSELSRLIRLVEESNVKNRIMVASPVTVEQSREYIAAFDVGIALMDPDVAPYCWQVKVNHYAASAVPSLITRCETFKKLEEHGVAIGINPPFDKDLAEKMNYLLTNDNYKNLGAKARKYALERLDWRIIVERIEGIIQEIKEES